MPKTRNLRQWRSVAMLAAALVLAMPSGRLRASDDTAAVGSGGVEVDIGDAIEHAQRSLGQFLRRMADPPAGAANFTLKVAVESGEAGAYLWVAGIRAVAGGFEAVVDDEAAPTVGLDSGQSIRFGRDAIVDWAYLQDGLMVGNFILRAELPTMPAAQADGLGALLAP